MQSDRDQLQSLLARVNSGDVAAWRELIGVTYAQLRRQAHAVFGRERTTLQATELLNSVLCDLLKLDLEGKNFPDPARYFAFVSLVLRRRLIDRWPRGRPRPGLIDSDFGDPARPIERLDLMAVHDALEELHELNERLWRVTELKYFYGLTNREIAERLEVTEHVVESDWTFTKSWLRARLGDRG